MPLTGLVQGSLDGQNAVMAAIDGMAASEYAEPSRLPGWSRAHVVAHLVGNALAQTRQVEHAMRGVLVEVYTGGQQARSADIQRRVKLPPAELAGLLRESHAAWEAVVRRVDDRVAIAPVAYRDGVVCDVIVGRWMESLVHGVDLGLPSAQSDEWTPDFSALLLDYLAERLPTTQRVRIQATDVDYDEVFEAGIRRPPTEGTSSDVHLRGAIAAIAAFLADRRSSADIESLQAPLGNLGPYPRGSIRS